MASTGPVLENSSWTCWLARAMLMPTPWPAPASMIWRGLWSGAADGDPAVGSAENHCRLEFLLQYLPKWLKKTARAGPLQRSGESCRRCRGVRWGRVCSMGSAATKTQRSLLEAVAG
jgi:hypothetical protein